MDPERIKLHAIELQYPECGGIHFTLLHVIPPLIRQQRVKSASPMLPGHPEGDVTPNSGQGSQLSEVSYVITIEFS